jgi:hypothetical protein
MLVKLRPFWVLNWYYNYAYLKKTKKEKATLISETYQNLNAGIHYLQNFKHYAGEYISVIEDITTEYKITFIDMRTEFMSKQVKFYDICHFAPIGHVLIAKALTEHLAEYEIATTSMYNI